MKSIMYGLFCLFLLALAVPVAAQDAIEVPWTDTPPIIDGDIGVEEWAGATVIQVEDGLAFTVGFFADDQYLYAAYAVTGDDTQDEEDQVGIYFDNDHDGAWPGECPGTTEGNYWLRINGGELEAIYRTIYQTEKTTAECESTEATAVTAAFSSTGGKMQYEVQIDFTAGEMYGAPEATIGVWLFAHDQGEGAMGWYPASDDLFNPAVYVALTYPPDLSPDDDTADDDTTDDDTGDDDDDNDDNDDTGDDDNDTDDDDNDVNDDDDDDDDDDGCGCQV